MNDEKWYYRLCLWCNIVYAAFNGLICVIFGSDPKSRFHAVDDVFLRVLGVAFIFFGIFLIKRKKWAFDGLIAVFFLKIIETLVTFDSGNLDPNLVRLFSKNVLTGIMVVVTSFLYIPPIIFLIWMRCCLGLQKSEHKDSADDVPPQELSE